MSEYKCQEESIPCPVCHGTGVGFDYFANQPNRKKCLSCDGTGLASWCKRFVAMQKKGLIDKPRPYTISKKQLPTHLVLSRHTTSYQAYERNAKAHGLFPMALSAIKSLRRQYRERGYDGLAWAHSWPDALVSILFQSRSLSHYFMMIRHYNESHEEQLPAKDKVTLINYRQNNPSKCQHTWPRAEYALELLRPDGSRSGEVELVATFSDLVQHIKSKNQYWEYNWEIQDGLERTGMGTTNMLREFMQHNGCLVNVSRKAYVAWLRERRGDEDLYHQAEHQQAGEGSWAYPR